MKGSREACRRGHTCHEHRHHHLCDSPSFFAESSGDEFNNVGTKACMTSCWAPSEIVAVPFLEGSEIVSVPVSQSVAYGCGCAKGWTQGGVPAGCVPSCVSGCVYPYSYPCYPYYPCGYPPSNCANRLGFFHTPCGHHN